MGSCRLSAVLAFFCASVILAGQPANTLSDQEKQQGWKLLFDGHSTGQWRGFKKEGIPDGWKAVDGTLARVDGGGDIVTVDEYDNFELRFDWKVGAGGNSGVFYRVSEKYAGVPMTGPEFQILDNSKHRDGQNPKTSAGSNYALDAPVKDVTRPVGEWNESRIVLDGNHVEHWMNGVKLLEYELKSDAWKEQVAKSKFSAWPSYGQMTTGRIALQDHGDPVSFRNLKIRPIKKS